jgi:hypothetical protein
MLTEQIGAEVAIELPPDGMNVIGLVLRVVVFEQEMGMWMR